MPKFVAKEDVEKGLVDPTKPLNQQPQYQKKLQQKKNTLKKEQIKHQSIKKKQPKHSSLKNQQIKSQSLKKEQSKLQQQQHREHQEKKFRRQRTDRPEFNWNKKEITLQTKIPETPKKLLPKPDIEKFKNELAKLKQMKEKLFQQKLKINDQQNFIIKSNSENKKGGIAALSKYGLEIRQKQNIKKDLFDKIHKLQDRKGKIQKQIIELKKKNDQLKHSKLVQLMSKQKLQERIDNLQQKLSSANLNKKQQAQINNSINESKRALLKAKSDIEINTQHDKNSDNIKICYDQIKRLKKQIDDYYQELKPLKGQIDLLQKKKDQEKEVVTEVKNLEEVKAQYEKKIKEIETQREGIQKKMDQLKIQYNKDLDLYEDQQDLLRYIKYVEQEIDYKRKRKEEQEKRQKQKEQRETKQKQEYQERQKKREQRKKQDEQRKQREQERKLKMHAEKQAFINRNPNWQSIEMCEFMIKYCQNIRPGNDLIKPNEQKAKNIEDINLGKQKEWENQAKSGCQVIVSKKTKNDEEAPKKTQKIKKQKVEDGEVSFSHSVDTTNRFNELSVLPPLKVSDIDQTIELLQQKISILSNPSQEAIEAFKIKAEKQFNRINGFSDQIQDQQKPVKHEKKSKTEKVELKKSDFPELN